jgi:hypothetical protein
MAGASTETQGSEELPIGHAVGRHSVVAFVSANGSSRFRPQDSIDRAAIVPGASKPALYFDNRVSVVISVILGRIVVPIIGIRIEDGKTKRVEKDERSIPDPWRNVRCGPRCRRSRHHW